MALYKSILGSAFDVLPKAIQEFHAGSGKWSGRAAVIRGSGLVPAIAAGLAGLPAASDDIALIVEVEERDDRQIWTRHFGTHQTRSELWLTADGLFERIGAARYAMQVKPTEDGLSVTVSHAHIIGVPLPRFLTPVSRSTETADDQGRYQFDVAGYLPSGQLIIRYHGWLKPAD